MTIKIATRGFGDPLNHYAHSGAWFKNKLYIGTSRANLQFLKLGSLTLDIPHWPVNELGINYSYEFERNVAAAEIWSLQEISKTNYLASRVYQAPFHEPSLPDRLFRSEISYRAMCTFKDGFHDRDLYVATTSRSEGDGPDILHTQDGVNFKRLKKPNVYNIGDQNSGKLRFTSIRNLVQFDDLLVTCVTGGSKGNINHSLNSCIFASADPSSGEWESINSSGFGTYPNCFCVFSLCKHGDYLYAGTAGLYGFSLFKGIRTGELSFHWELVLSNGAGRGSLNQGIASMCSFGDDLYLGTGIQSGGYDRVHKVGPAAFEILRLTPSGQVDVIVGDSRSPSPSLSGYSPGFSNPFNAYLWRMEVHKNKLYVGTLDTSIFSLFTSHDKLKIFAAEKLKRCDILEWLKTSGGADLWCTCDGLFWEQITANGFNNFYNYGIRTIVSNGNSLFVGTANPFGPKIWNTSSREYEDNLLSGTEIIRIDQ